MAAGSERCGGQANVGVSWIFSDRHGRFMHSVVVFFHRGMSGGEWGGF